MDQPPEQQGDQSGQPIRAPYRKQIHLELVVALALICVVLTAVGWSLRPQSNGFPAIPSDLSVDWPTSGDVTQILTRTSSNGATLDIASRGSASDPRSWMVTIRNLGAGKVCTRGDYNDPSGSWVVHTLPQHVTTHAVPAPPGVKTGAQPVTLITGSGGVYVRLCWSSNAPVSLNGSYLSARFPPLQGTGPSVAGYLGGDQGGDQGASLTRLLYPDAGNTANFNVQQSVTPPTYSTTDTWGWSARTSPQAVRLSAIDVSGTQHDSYRAFLSGIALGVAGGALIALIAELVVPWNRKRDKKWDS